jgi:chromosome segregation ATPase
LEAQIKLKDEKINEKGRRIRVLEEDNNKMSKTSKECENAKDKLNQICVDSDRIHKATGNIEKLEISLDGAVSKIHKIINNQGNDNQEFIQRNNELEKENSILKDMLHSKDMELEEEIELRFELIGHLRSLTEGFVPKSNSPVPYSNLKKNK